ncbi:PREDICTED: protein STRUBBELIG-RECEPTOR FAMILY 8 isoform X3 [Brassica oleracea var. oleracea]|uniref:protein STRUBBELIG-RECEPTOR FAMILY 8 isoform X3 n=1 Tax=Brassica oleracea var. oleracea TaxID=109376 RepID=UPI0006A703D3|nr:PREDICTED: protein STRUBBELIG-RECEPTOR FAMILY 8 isoform X3 [Brassica oleracea var. oleracea]
MATGDRAMFPVLLLIFSAISGFSVVHCVTDPSDVQALQVLYTSLNSPSQLTNWKNGGSDPCGESWKGITCDRSAVVSMDVSGNSIHDTLPYQLPPNLTSLNLARNNLSGNLPYSISAMASLTYMNVSGNSLSMSIGDIFADHNSLSTLDLSHNNFSGDLPSSVSTVSKLSVLYVQNNELTGTIDVLSGLPLTTLNVANNHFNGSIPKELTSIKTLLYDGNSFDNAPASPQPERPDKKGKPSGSKKPKTSPKAKGKGLSGGVVSGIVFGSLFVAGIIALVLYLCLHKKRKKVGGSTKRASQRSLPLSGTTQVQEQTVKDLKSSPAEKVTVDRVMKNGSISRMRSPITASPYTVSSLQVATNSFSQENIIGEGSLGRVYRAEFPNGKVMAIKKIDNAALSLQEEDNFLEAVSNMSRLRHPNIVPLAGYCTEHGQRLLVYEYVGNGNLDDMLHLNDDRSMNLTWNARVKVALGTAKALEYLHEVCLPSVVHRNFKSANILLDEELNPHLSDCGLAALNPNTERRVSTQMVGSFGYSSPEFALSGIYTVKSDVYTFGVVMLALLTGRKPLDSSRTRAEQSLVRWATPQLHDIDALSKMVDPSLNGMYPAKSLSRFADIIALCIQPEPEFRPPMSEVVQQLVRLVQRASVVKRRSSDDNGFSYRTPEHEHMDFSF